MKVFENNPLWTQETTVWFSDPDLNGVEVGPLYRIPVEPEGISITLKESDGCFRTQVANYQEMLIATLEILHGINQ